MSHLKAISHDPCWNCGCQLWTYNEIEADMGEYKVKRQDCGRLLEGSRAQEAIEASLIENLSTTS